MGDYNSTLAANESWGMNARNDPLAEKIGKLFYDYGLMNIKPASVVLTWKNRRKGPEYIAKRLDRSMIKTSLLRILGNL